MWVLPAVWLVAKQAALCGAVEVLGSRAVHMQVTAGTGMQPNSSGPSGLCHEPKLQAKLRRLLFLVLTVSSEDVYLLSLTSRSKCKYKSKIIFVILRLLFCIFFCFFGFFNALFAVIL